MENKYIEYAIKCHAETNHMYDKYLPYEFHLRMVRRTAEMFIVNIIPIKHEDVFAACWCHDLIEDTRQSYSDVEKNTSKDVAEIVRCVTNYGRGRNRKERMPNEVYNDIRNNNLALFVKLCDRISNVQYSKMTGSPMFEMYKKEHEYFKSKLYKCDFFISMWDYLDSLFIN